MTFQYFAGVELGGTKCVCVLADGKGLIEAETRIPTTTPSETIARIEAVLDGWYAARPFHALGIGSFGPLDLDPLSPNWGSITSTPKPGWRDTNIAARLQARYPVPVGLDTDVNGAALAEGNWGACRGMGDYAYVTVGTGVGVGVIVGHNPLQGFGHPEIGHIRVARLPGDDWTGSCPYHGDCVEGLVAGPALAKRSGRSPDSLHVSDPIWTGVVHTLAQMLHTIVLTAAPRRILMGGGVMQSQPHLFAPIRAALVKSLGEYVSTPGIIDDIEAYVAPPALGDRAGPLGAIAIAMKSGSAGVKWVSTPKAAIMGGVREQ